jgi:hypothetical protein
MMLNEHAMTLVAHSFHRSTRPSAQLDPWQREVWSWTHANTFELLLSSWNLFSEKFHGNMLDWSSAPPQSLRLYDAMMESTID